MPAPVGTSAFSPGRGGKSNAPATIAPRITGTTGNFATMIANAAATTMTALTTIARSPSRAAARASGREKFSPTSSIAPADAGTTPRSAAATAGWCATCTKSAASRQVIAALGSNSPASDAAIPRLPANFRPIRIVSAIKLMPGVSVQSAR